MKMSTLHLLSNSLTGAVPSALCTVESLSVLSFGSNALSCYAPCFSSVPSLQNGSILACKDSSTGSKTLSLNPTPRPSAGEIEVKLSICSAIYLEDFDCTL